ncbi:MAG: hypothetical protein ACXVJT_01520 [Thermoanaerobaculia bacterium]
MKLFRKLVAMALYAALLLPGSEYHVTSWLKAVELTSTVLDRTMRRRKSQIQNEHLARFLRSLQIAERDREDATLS